MVTILRNQARNVLLVAAGVAVSLSALWLYSVAAPPKAVIDQAVINEAVARTLASATPAAPPLAEVYERVRASVVQVETRVVGQNDTVEEGRGSGIVIDERGSILTSLHVVQKPGRIYAIFADGSRSEATIAATDPENDIAVLRALQPPRGLVAAVLADSRELRIGQEALVVGSPFGLTGSFTLGVISGLGRSFQASADGVRLSGLIQVDAAINPGNSGGPLLNRDGDVVGIVTGIANPTGQGVFIGIGFAVPIEAAVTTAGPPPF